MKFGLQYKGQEGQAGWFAKIPKESSPSVKIFALASQFHINLGTFNK